MSLSQAKARRFIAVLEDIIARIPIDPADFPELTLPPMFFELNELAMGLGVKSTIAKLEFAIDEQARQVQLEFDQRLRDQKGVMILATPNLHSHIVDELAAKLGLTRDKVCELLGKPYAHSSLWLEWRSPYGMKAAAAIWYMTPVREGPLAGSPVKENFVTRRSLGDFVTSLREWQRWTQGIIGEIADADRIPGSNIRPKEATDATIVRAAAGLEELNEQTPPYSPESDDWISGKTMAKRLGVTTKTLRNRRGNGSKSRDGLYGVDADNRFWRKPPSSHPFYYSPPSKHK